MNLSKEAYQCVHINLIAKSIEELQFEDVFEVVWDGDTACLSFEENISYEFSAKLGIWNNLHIDRLSLLKKNSGQIIKTFTVHQFFDEAKRVCGMSDETLCKYLEEASNTLFSDLFLESKYSSLTMSKVLDMNFVEIDQLLPGHPKLLMNKGRVGWSANERERYAPEYSPSFQLNWVAIHEETIQAGPCDTGLNHQVIKGMLSKDDWLKIEDVLKDRLSEFYILPIHPWQWNQYIKIQYLDYLVEDKIIDLGVMCSCFTPQTSLRTLSVVDTDCSFDVKLPLSILNTSCVRGLPHRHIESGYKVSDKVDEILRSDTLLKNVSCLKEVIGISCSHPHFNKIPDAPYRYKELLGCVWRESVNSKLSPSETAIPTAALIFQFQDEYFLRSLVEKSETTIELWIEKYFKVVVLPLYHLQLKYGLGLVAHSQNTILVMENYVPKRLIIKDFHGDLRISTKSPYVLDEAFKNLEKLSPEYLIHDLVTGHIISFLRYLSLVTWDVFSFSEEKFYSLLGNVVLRYLSDVDCDVSNQNLHLCRPFFEKVLVNSVRFKAGYGESSQRLKPMLGINLKNPLHRSGGADERRL